jgi:putative hemolysin
MTIPLAVSLVALCLIAQGAYAGAEIACVSANRGALQDRAEQGDGGAALALTLLDEEDNLLGTCLVGSMLALVAGTVTVAAALDHYGFGSPWIAAAAYVPLALVLGDALPKQVHKTRATSLAPYMARFVRVSQWLFVPLLPVVRAYASFLSRITGSKRRDTLTRQEILWLLQEPSAPGDEFDAEQQQMIQRVFEITETVAVDTMTPLVDVDAVPMGSTVRQAIEMAVRHGHTRLPVYEERVVHIAGVLHVRDLLLGADDAPIRELVKPVKYVPEGKRVDELLQEMRRERETFVVVVDEYGGSVGILTIEDILEEIFGEIHDERDRDDHGVRRLSEHEWRVPARLSAEQLASIVGRDLPEGDFETVGGLLLSVLGRIPRKGEVVAVEGLTFRVDEANDRSVQAVTVKATPRGGAAAPRGSGLPARR